MDYRFRAFDPKTGKELWSTRLENNAVATPMTYQGKSGKQYVATVAGGGLDNFVKPAPEGGGKVLVVAYTLP